MHLSPLLMLLIRYELLGTSYSIQQVRQPVEGVPRILQALRALRTSGLVLPENLLAGPVGLISSLHWRVAPGLQCTADRPPGLLQGPRRIVYEACLGVLKLPPGPADGHVLPGQ